MNWLKYIFGLVCLFLASCVAIVYGYYNDILGFGISVPLEFRELPVLTSALFITLSCPVTHIIAFRKCPENYDGFKMFGFPIAYVVALVVMFYVEPKTVMDETVMEMTREVPLWLAHPVVMYLLLVGAFYGVYHWLHLDFWRFARRETQA